MDGKPGASCARPCMSNPTGRATVGLTGTRRLAGLGGGCAFIRIKRDIKASAPHHCCTCLARGRLRVSPISRRRTSPEGGYAIMLCIWRRTSLEPLDSVIALTLDELEFGLEGTNGRAAGLQL